MKKLTTKILMIAACVAMLLTAGPIANTQSVQAATKAQGTINLATKKLTISKGKTQRIKSNTLTMVKARRYQVKTKFGSTTVTKTGTYKSSKPAIATVSATGLVTAKAPGTTTIKVTYNGKAQSFKIKVVDTSAHKHTWKTLTKSTCASKGKKLCKTCGVTGTTAMKTTHSFELTKKATCKAKGVQTCTVCGTTESIAKTKHEYITKTSRRIEGRGKPYEVVSTYCGGCGTDMTDWTKEEVQKHQTNFDNFQCFGANIYGVDGEVRYPKYVIAETVEIYCKHCGAWKSQTTTDLYECDAYGNRNTANNVTSKKAPAKAVAAPQDVITDNTDADVNTDAVSDETVSENEVVSDNTIDVSDEVNTEITDPETGSDSVFDEDDDDTFDKSLSDNDR